MALFHSFSDTAGKLQHVLGLGPAAIRQRKGVPA
jgi:hypothetical protein